MDRTGLGSVASILLTQQSGLPKSAKAWHGLSLGELGVDERAYRKCFPVQDKQEDLSAGAAFCFSKRVQIHAWADKLGI